jgi:hypothetical protein
MTALDDLIAAVEAGKCWLYDSEKWDSLGIDGMDASEAFYGDLNAALRLHESLLPGWAVKLWAQADDDADACVYPPIAVPPDYPGRTEGVDTFSAEVAGCNPARAWLLSILRAYHATKTEGS